MNRRSPSGPRISWQEPVDAFVDLPLDGNEDGDVRLTTGTDEIWIWNGAAWVPPTGLGTDERVKVSAADTTPGFLSDKLPTTPNVLAVIGTPGGNEDLLLSVVGITEPFGPTILPFGPIADGQLLRRVGAFVVGASMSATSSGILFWGNSSVTGTTSTRYLEPGYGGVIAPLVAAIVQIRSPISGFIRNLFVRQNGPAGNGNSIVYTARVNGVASALSVSIASTTANGSDTTDSVAVVAGDLIDIEVTKALSTGASPARIEVSMEVGA